MPAWWLDRSRVPGRWLSRSLCSNDSCMHAPAVCLCLQSRVQHKGTPAELYYAVQQFKSQVSECAHGRGQYRDEDSQGVGHVCAVPPHAMRQHDAPSLLACQTSRYRPPAPAPLQRGRPRGDLPALVHQLGLEQGVLNQPWVELSVRSAMRPAW